MDEEITEIANDLAVSGSRQERIVIRKDYMRKLIAGVRKMIERDVTVEDGERYIHAKWIDADILCDVVEKEIINNDNV